MRTMASTLARQTKSPGRSAPQSRGLPLTRAVAQLLRAEIREARGCAEPAAIAYAAVLARRSLGKQFNSRRAHVPLQLSPGLYRNASTAVLRVLGQRGIVAAVFAWHYSQAHKFVYERILMNGI